MQPCNPLRKVVRARLQWTGWEASEKLLLQGLPEDVSRFCSLGHCRRLSVCAFVESRFASGRFTLQIICLNKAASGFLFGTQKLSLFRSFTGFADVRLGPGIPARGCGRLQGSGCFCTGPRFCRDAPAMARTTATRSSSCLGLCSFVPAQVVVPSGLQV